MRERNSTGANRGNGSRNLCFLCFLLFNQGGHSEGIGWKPGVLGWLLRAPDLRSGGAGGDGLGQVAPAVDLLRGLDKNALAGGQQAELVNRDRARVWQHGQADRGQMNVDLDGEFVARQVAGLAEDGVRNFSLKGPMGAGKWIASELRLW